MLNTTVPRLHIDMAKIAKILIILVLITLVFLFLMPIFMPLNSVVVEESYLQFLSYLDFNLVFLAKDHTVPLWAFHFGGGYPFINHPENISLSPLFYLLIVPFGAAIGTKLFLVLAYIVGVFGFYIFARKILKYGFYASAIAAMFFAFNAHIAFRINTGGVVDSLWFYLPCIMYMLFLSKQNSKYIFYCACLIAIVFLSGFGILLIPMLLFVFIMILFDTFSKPLHSSLNHKSLLINFGVISAVSLLLAAAKTIPVLELLSQNSRKITLYADASANAMTFHKLFYALFSAGPYATGNELIMGESGLGIGSVMYIGIIPALLFICSCIFCFKKVWKYLVVITIFVCLSMANNSPLDLFFILWHLPLFASIHEAAVNFSFPIVFMMPVVIGQFLSSELVKKRRLIKVCIYLIALFGAVNMFFVNRQYHVFTKSYQESVPEMNLERTFFNIKTVPFDSIKNTTTYSPKKVWLGKYKDELPEGLQYYLLRQNIGLINWYGNIRLQESALEKYKTSQGYGDYWRDFRVAPIESNGVFKNEHYKGESYFVSHSDNKVKNIQWNANEVILELEQTMPDVLVINQNYHPYWKAVSGDVHDKNGLLAVRLTKPVKGEVKLTYRPLTFYIGALISILSFGFCIWYFFISRKPDRSIRSIK